MCDLSLSYSFQIYTATPSVFTHMYRLFASVAMDTLSGVAVKVNL